MSSNAGILSSYRGRGLLALALTLVLILFYVFLYWDKDIDQNFLWGDSWSNLQQHHKMMLSDLDKISPIEKQNLEKQAYLAEYSILHLKKGVFATTNVDGREVALGKSYEPYVERLRSRFSVQKALYTIYSKLNPLSYGMRGKPADKWFLYGFLYTVLVVSMGIRFIRKWKNDKYQRMRTLSVMFFQFVLAFLVPSFLEALGGKGFYFHYFWPLKFEYIFPGTLSGFPRAMALWALGMSFIAVPTLTYFYGKRWYCSWVCGCGALANTFGDSFRHLSSKSSLAWKIEKVSVYSILAITIVATVLIVTNQLGYITGAFQDSVFKIQRWYGFFITAGFAGVVGTGFYPILGSRVWCRFGCPQAAILGIFQKLFSRFRITTNGDQCMSCGTCSTYCEMGIDVRAYAMQGKDIIRSACVGCGICMSVCPRGVLKLENGPRGVQL